MSDYPQHEKLAEVQDASQAIGEFLDLSGYTLCRLVRAGDNGEPKWIDRDGNPTNEGGFDEEWNPAYESWRDHYQPVGDINGVLAEFFEIDRDELEREKRAMLASLRAANSHSTIREGTDGRD